MEIDSSVELGRRAKNLRMSKGLRIAEVAAVSGLAGSTISKVENGQMALTYDRLLQLARGLRISLVELLHEAGSDVAVEAAANAPFQGWRIVTPDGQGRHIDTQWYEYWYLCTGLGAKDMIPILGSTKARSIEEFGEFIVHAGQEFVYVLSGILEVHTEHYVPTPLKPEDSMYFDSGMGHAYIAGDDTECRFLIVCSGGAAGNDVGRVLSRAAADRRQAKRKVTADAP